MGKGNEMTCKDDDCDKQVIPWENEMPCKKCDGRGCDMDGILCDQCSGEGFLKYWEKEYCEFCYTLKD
jgi:hypothetical protein